MCALMSPMPQVMSLAIFSAPKRWTGSPPCSAPYDFVLNTVKRKFDSSSSCKMCLCRNYDIVLIAHLLGDRVGIAFVAVILY